MSCMQVIGKGVLGFAQGAITKRAERASGTRDIPENSIVHASAARNLFYQTNTGNGMNKKMVGLVALAYGLSACGGAPSINSSSSSSGSGGSGSTISEREMAAYFSGFACGVDFSAWGSGSSACFRTPTGGAQCIGTLEGTATPIVWQDSGQPVTHVLRYYGGGIKSLSDLLITDSGQAFAGFAGRLRSNPIVNAGVISGAVAYRQHCLIVKNQQRGQVLCYSDSYGEHLNTVEGLPATFDAIQLASDELSSLNMCALSTNGRAWCWQWQAGDDFFPAAEVKFSAPVKSISVGDKGVCGVKFSGGIECSNGWSATPETLPKTQLTYQSGSQLLTLNEDAQILSNYGSNVTKITDHAAGIGHSSYGAYIQISDGNTFSLQNNQLKQLPNLKAQAAQCPF